MLKQSAGILLYQKDPLRVLLVHPGGPFWANKDEGSWSIPKGEMGPNEDLLHTAQREVYEELGISIRESDLSYLGSISTGRKINYIFAANKDFDTSSLKSNNINIEYPPNSGNLITIPEVDKAEWFPLETAKFKINKNQIEFLTRLVLHVG